MAVKGSASKVEIVQKILEYFPGSFTYNKEIRIPMMEDGAEIQIKVTLTAAKDNVEHGGDIAMPGENSSSEVATVEIPPEPTQEEKDRLTKLMASLF